MVIPTQLILSAERYNNSCVHLPNNFYKFAQIFSGRGSGTLFVSRRACVSKHNFESLINESSQFSAKGFPFPAAICSIEQMFLEIQLPYSTKCKFLLESKRTHLMYLVIWNSKQGIRLLEANKQTSFKSTRPLERALISYRLCEEYYGFTKLCMKAIQ